MSTNFGDYKSPVNKLVSFFKHSRDSWKEKYKDTKYSEKKLKNQIHYQKQKKDELKQRVSLLEEENSRLRTEVRKMEDLVEKKSPAPRRNDTVPVLTHSM